MDGPLLTFPDYSNKNLNLIQKIEIFIAILNNHKIISPILLKHFSRLEVSVSSEELPFHWFQLNSFYWAEFELGDRLKYLVILMVV